MRKQDITLRWQYSSGQDYEFHSSDSAVIGKLYRLKILEHHIVKASVSLGDFEVISWTKPEED
jgi:hypothetical protein